MGRKIFTSDFNSKNSNFGKLLLSVKILRSFKTQAYLQKTQSINSQHSIHNFDFVELFFSLLLFEFLSNIFQVDSINES